MTHARKPFHSARRILSACVRVVCTPAAAALLTGLLCGGPVGSAQTAHFSASQTDVATEATNGLDGPEGVAVDSAGNLYISDTGNARVLKETLSGTGYVQSTVREWDTSLVFEPWGVAVDASGNVYISGWGSAGSQILKETPSSGGYIESTVASVYEPTTVVVDGSGNIYTVPMEPVPEQLVEETPSTGGYSQSIVASGFNDVWGLAMDGNRNFYVSEGYENSGKDEVFEVPWTGSGYGAPVALENLSVNGPWGLAADHSGNLYIANFGGDGGSNSPPANQVVELPWTGSGFGSQIALGVTGLSNPRALAVDASGDLYIADDNIVKYGPGPAEMGLIPVGLRSGIATVTFAFDSSGSLNSSMPYQVLTQGQPNLNFVDAGAPTCAANISYNAGDTCSVNVSFNPTAVGTENGSVALYGASGNVIATAVLSGTGIGIAPENAPFGIVTPAVDSVTGGTTVGTADSVVVSGWVADAVDGAPLSNVTVYIDGKSAGTPTLGIPRPNVAAAYDNAAYLDSGFQMLVPASTLSLGVHFLEVVAINSREQSSTFPPTSFYVAATASAGEPFGSVDKAVSVTTGSTSVAGGDSLLVRGWAADPTEGTSITSVEILIDAGGWGTATMGLPRPDVAAARNNPAYIDSGWTFTVPVFGLAAGSHTVSALVTTSLGLRTTLNGLRFSVEPTAAGPPLGLLTQAVDAATGETTVSSGDDLLVQGWAADPSRGAPTSAVQIIIDGVLNGYATVGLPRPDVAAKYNNSSYLDSGWTFTEPASGLTAGTHNVRVVAWGASGLSTILGNALITVTP